MTCWRTWEYAISASFLVSVTQKGVSRLANHNGNEQLHEYISNNICEAGNGMGPSSSYVALRILTGYNEARIASCRFLEHASVNLSYVLLMDTCRNRQQQGSCQKLEIDFNMLILFARKTSLFAEALGDGAPVDDVPDGAEVLGLAVLVLEVVGVLPGVDAEEGLVVAGDGVLVGAGDDGEVARGLVLDEPGPAGALDAGEGGVGLLLEVFKGAKVLLDGGLLLTPKPRGRERQLPFFSF